MTEHQANEPQATERQGLVITRHGLSGDIEALGRTRAIGLWVAATLAVAIVLAALTWTSALNAIRAERRTAEDHALATLSVGATLAAVAYDHRLREAGTQLAMIAQAGIAQAGGGDPATLSLTPPRGSLLPRVAGSRLFLLDGAGTVLRSTDPGGAGRKLPAPLARAVHRALAEAGHPALVGSGLDTRVVLAQALRSPAAPAILAMTVPLHAILAPLLMPSLAPRSAVLLVTTADWRMRAAIGRIDTALPEVLGGTAIASATPGPGGSAAGIARLVPGGQRVLFARRPMPGQDFAIVIVRTRAAALESVRATTAGTRRFAVAITALIALATLVALGELAAMLRRERRLARDRATLARAKQEADAKTAQLEGLLAGLPDGVLMMDGALRLVAWNAQLADLAGLPAALLRPGTTLEAMLRAQAEAGEFGPIDVAAEVAHRLAVYQRGGSFGRSERLRPDGREIEIRRVPLPDGGFVGMFSDITERKRAERALTEARAAAEAATLAKSRFVAMVSHEIGTPLQALLNGIGLLADAPLDPVLKRLLGEMRQTGVSLLRLLGDILDVSRMEAGRLALRPERCDPCRKLEQVRAMLAPQAAARGIRTVLDCAPDVPRRILADPERVGQVATNLLSNAIKFSRPGTVTVSVARVAGPAIRIAVADPGPVIPPVERERRFQPFAARAGGRPDAAGVGLGLAICRDLVALMGGEIGYAPAAEGNLFWFTLPLAPGAEGTTRAEAPAERARARLAARGRRLRVLLAEDVAVSRLVTATMLRREGHSVIAVADGRGAVQAAAHHDFDLILMDLDLPGLDGQAAARAIRALPGAAGQPPILALSGQAGANERRACRDAGMQELLAKPASRDLLLDALARHAGLDAPARAAAPEQDSVGGAGNLSALRLAELRETLAPEALARVTEECLDELSRRLGLLALASERRDGAASLAEAHAMAGLAGGYGLIALEREARLAMRAVREGRWDDPALDAARLGRELAASAEALRRAVGSPVA
ncbi:MAG: PAS-domain containing protein [Rhodospirillales bacterium]|nr:PAS-domain containing protein [Rhodospirillales bacterium]